MTSAGEVWLCSGQSNMEFPTGQALDVADDIAASADADPHGTAGDLPLWRTGLPASTFRIDL